MHPQFKGSQQNYEYVSVPYRNSCPEDFNGLSYEVVEKAENEHQYSKVPKCILAGPAISSDEESFLSENLISINDSTSNYSSTQYNDYSNNNSNNNGNNDQRKIELVDSPEEPTVTKDATKAAFNLLNELKSLWLNLANVSSSSSTTALCGGDYRLTHIIGLCSFIVKEMEGEWKALVSSQSDTTRIKELQESNHLLIEKLEHSKTVQTCLESEINLMVKEKAVLLEQMNGLAAQLSISSNTQNSGGTNKVVACNSGSNGSFGFNFDPEERNDSIKKREDDFDSLMEVVKERDTTKSFYLQALEKYDNELIELQNQIEAAVNEKSSLQNAYYKLLEEKERITREHGHYESLLKIILQERQQSEDFDSLEFLQNIFGKLHEIDLSSKCDKKCCSKLAVLDSSLKHFQEQNTSFRSEMSKMRENLNMIAEEYLKCKNELDENNQTHKQQIEEMATKLNNKCEELKELHKSHDEKCNELQSEYATLREEKVNIEKLLAERETDLHSFEESVESLQKANFKYQRKVQELHKTNSRITSELQEYKQNMSDLNEIINQLRSTLREQKIQWTERIRAGSHEIAQCKSQCTWLQSQIEHLNSQLIEANERLKAHERDKSYLAQQVLSAEEERKVVDRKLQELRSVFQGDTALRDALMERNEALQMEINRLRKSNLMQFEVNNNFLSYDDNTATASNTELSMSGTNPPSATNGADDTIMSTFNNLLPVDSGASTTKLFERHGLKGPSSVVTTAVNSIQENYLRHAISVQAPNNDMR